MSGNDAQISPRARLEAEIRNEVGHETYCDKMTSSHPCNCPLDETTAAILGAADRYAASVVMGLIPERITDARQGIEEYRYKQGWNECLDALRRAAAQLEEGKNETT